MLNSRFIFFTLLLSALALWIAFQQNTSTTTASKGSSLQSTDYSWQLFNATTWQLDKTDNHKNTITQAKSMFYQEALKKSELAEPRILISQPQQTLTIRSQSGETYNESKIDLSGNVVITQYDLPYAKVNTQSQNKTLQTEFITYNANTQKISSPKDVTITQPGAITTGTGLKADIQKKQFQLLSNVKGQYDPQYPQGQ
ncbi:LPS export ABC transporter periplasmic protein LptC [Thiomicrorhabdus sp. ZW0627]|uniref:LPS export ABC transporter periplasmic protein LptC n=1 Tax=Thiomicrorhabdus sp. ZW0627 TaxID=3039774 RepID=UPI00243678E0|nr:LPS export ABC transporter periplasmic protein LptC [Thiomicrorhabdus sp. ZW0627]MDG6773581.1 LPS export ABC transporter periplasmic protein LptC [Thiomicrorhabdus sp. ZW0627]